MAIFSNFEGTLKSSITMGKGTGKFTINTDGANDTIEFRGQNGRASIEIGTPTETYHAATKTYIDSKLTLTGTAIPANEFTAPSYKIIDNQFIHNDRIGQMDINGVPKLDGNGIIETAHLPSFSLGSAYVADNFYAMEKMVDDGTVINVGDILTIPGIDVWRPNMSVQSGTIYRSIGWDNPDNQDNNDFWLCTTTHLTGSEFPYEADGTAKVGLETEAGYWSNSSPDNAAGTGPTYSKGDEFLWLNTIYVAVADNQNDPSNTPNADWVEDGPDAGTYIVTQTADPQFSENFRPLSGGVNVTAFNGRVGTVYPQSGDYNAAQIAISSDVDEIVADGVITLKGVLDEVATTRLKLTGGEMSGQLVIVSETSQANFNSSVPAIALSTNTSTGIYGSATGAIALSFNGTTLAEFNAAAVDYYTNISMNGSKIIDLATPTSGTDAATKDYVDGKPTLIGGEIAPTGGNNGDAYFEFSPSGTITTPFSARWSDIATDGNTWIAISETTVGDKAVRSTNEGKTWETITLPDSGIKYTQIHSNAPDCFVVMPETVDTANNQKAYYTVNSGDTWQEISLTGMDGAYSLLKTEAGKDYLIVKPGTQQVWRSMDNGITWTQGNDIPSIGAQEPYWYYATQDGNKIILTVDGEKDSGAFGVDSTARSRNYAVSTDGGDNWTISQFPGDAWTFAPVSYNNGSVYLVPKASGVTSELAWRSLDGGLNWSAYDIGPVLGWRGGISNGSSGFFLGESIDRIRYTTDGGSTFSNNIGALSGTFLAGATNGYTTIVLKGWVDTDQPVFRTTDMQNASDVSESSVNNIHYKANDEWMGLAIVTANEARTQYVSKTGDTMTGQLNVGADIVSDGDIYGSNLDLINTKTIGDVSTISLGSTSGSYGGASEVENWRIVATESTGNGNKLQFIGSAMNGGLESSMLDLFGTAVHATGQLQLNTLAEFGQGIESSVFAAHASGNGYAGILHSAKKGLLIASEASDTTNVLELFTGVTTVDETDAATYITGTPTFAVNAEGTTKTLGKVLVGDDVVVDNNITLDVHTTDDRTVGIRVDNRSQSANKSAVDAIRVVSLANADLHTNYSHFVAIEGSSTVFDLNKSALVVNKKVTLNGTLSTHNGDVMIGGTSGVILPKGTDAQRVALAEEGTLRYNTDSDQVEVKASSGWEAVGGSFAPQTFNIANADWTSRGAAVDGIESFEYRIAASTHGLGADVFCQFKERVSGTYLPGVVYRNVDFYYEVDSTGQIFILAEDVDRAALPTDVQVRVSL